MELAPHVSFRANVPPDAEYEDLPGHSLAREIEARYRAEGFEIEDLDCWRGAGWFINCSVSGKRFETYFLACRDEGLPRDWILAIAPLGQPGFIARLFGRKPTPYVRELRRLAEMVELAGATGEQAQRQQGRGRASAFHHRTSTSLSPATEPQTVRRLSRFMTWMRSPSPPSPSARPSVCSCNAP